jgi:hypothetical protein
VSVTFDKVQYLMSPDGNTMSFEGMITCAPFEVLAVNNPSDVVTRQLLDCVRKEAAKHNFAVGEIIETEFTRLAIVDRDFRWTFKIRVNDKHITDGKPPGAVGMKRLDAEWNF